MEAAGSPVKAEQTRPLPSHTHRTHCFRERDGLHEEFPRYHTWLYYAGRANENVPTYAAVVTGGKEPKAFVKDGQRPGSSPRAGKDAGYLKLAGGCTG